ncbi:MAG: hypothetical protein PHW10_01870 [Candidatus Peribacteraceae bacterium]|nr:hypothetical protein [Candidatus Peribacteraceae bacterium]
MPGNYLVWNTQMFMGFDPHRPDSRVSEADIVRGAGEGCPDCPALKQAALPAYVQQGSRGKFATVLCGQTEQYTTSGIVRGCQGNESRKCMLHKREARIEGETMPLYVMDANVVETRYDHQHRTDGIEWRRGEVDLRTLSPEALQRMADTVALDCTASLNGALSEVRRLCAQFPTVSAAERPPLLLRLLRVKDIAARLEAPAA